MPNDIPPVVLGAGLNDRILAELPGRATRIAAELLTASRLVLSGSRSGSQIVRGGRAWRASAPGEAPATATGALLRSWRPYTVPGASLGEPSIDAGIVSSGVPYVSRFDPMLPGYAPGRRPIAARPFVEPIVEAAWSRIVAIVEEPWLR